MATFRKVADKWKAEVCVNGLRKSKSLPSKMAARSWASEMEFQLSVPPVPASSTHTLAHVFTRYADEVSQLKKGARWEVIRLAGFGRDPIAQVRLIDLQREDVEAFILRRSKTVLSSSVNRELSLISHCLTQARRWRLMEHNPFNDLKRPKNPPHRDRRILDNEINAILTALKYSNEYPIIQQQQRVAVAFLLAIESAMRAGEICSLVARNIDIEKRTVYLPDTKNGLPRYVPLSTEAVRLLCKLQPWALDEPVFNMPSGTLSTLFKKGVGRAGIEGLTFHDTRHEAITRLAKKLDVLDLARMVGHRDIKQLMTYYNKSAAELAGQLD